MLHNSNYYKLKRAQKWKLELGFSLCSWEMSGRGGGKPTIETEVMLIAFISHYVFYSLLADLFSCTGKHQNKSNILPVETAVTIFIWMQLSLLILVVDLRVKATVSSTLLARMYAVMLIQYPRVILRASISATSSTDFVGLLILGDKSKTSWCVWILPHKRSMLACSGEEIVMGRKTVTNWFWNHLWNREEARSTMSILIWMRDVLLWNLSPLLGWMKLHISEMVILLLEQELCSLTLCSPPSLS